MIEADYIVLAPRNPTRREAAATTGCGDRLALQDLLPGQRKRLPLAARLGRMGFSCVVTALALVCFFAAGGHVMVPGGTTRSGTDGPTLTLLDSGVRTIGGRRVLNVEVEVANTTSAPLHAPPVAALIVNGSGATMHYAMAGPHEAGTMLAPGARWRLASRLPVPGHGVRSLRVSFAP